MTAVALASLLELDHLCYPENPLTEGQLRRALSGSRWVVASDPERRVYLVAECRGEGDRGVVVLRRLGVRPGERAKGLGKKLLSPMLEHACVCTLKETNSAGLSFLRSLGFRAVGVERGRWGSVDGVVLRSEPGNKPKKTLDSEAGAG